MSRLRRPLPRPPGCPCGVCRQVCTMEQESIQCDGCECWMHQQCIQMSASRYVHISQSHLQFFCKQCVSNGNGFNFSASLCRVAHCSPDIACMRSQAECELNLLQFYCVCLPDVQTSNMYTHCQLLCYMTSVLGR